MYINTGFCTEHRVQMFSAESCIYVHVVFMYMCVDLYMSKAYVYGPLLDFPKWRNGRMAKNAVFKPKILITNHQKLVLEL